MAKTKDEILQELSDLNRELQTSKARFEADVKSMGVSLAGTTEDAFKNYTDITKLIRDTLSESAKMSITLEESVKLMNRINALKGEEVTLEKQLNSILNGIGATDRAAYKLAQSEKKLRSEELADLNKKYELEEDNLVMLQAEFAALASSRTAAANARRAQVRLEADAAAQRLTDIETERAMTEFILSSLDTKLQTLNQEAQLEADIIEHQKESIKNTLMLAQQHKNMIASGVKSSSFWKELGERLFPSMAGHTKRLSSDMAKFGKGAGIALAGVAGLALAIKMLADSMFRSDKEATELAKRMSVTREEARATLRHFENVATSMRGVMFTSRDILKSQHQLNDAMGTSVYMSEANLKTTTKLRDLMGVTEEAMSGILKNSLMSGKSMETFKNEILGASKIAQIQNGIMLDDKKILESVAKTTGSIRANFKGNVRELASAVVRARTLGIELGKVMDISEKLLDFESSISSELEAELLTGRQLNMERARSAALVGDMATVMEEMAKQAGDFGQFSSMNVIQQKKLAEAFGFSRDEFSDMLAEQSALNALRARGISADQQSLITTFDRLKREGKDVTAMLGEELATRLEAQSAQDRFNKTIEKLQTVFDRLVQGGLIDKLTVSLANLVQSITEKGFWGLFSGPKNPYTAESLGLSDSAKSSMNSKDTGIKDSMDKNTKTMQELIKISRSNADMSKKPQSIIMNLNAREMGTALASDNNNFA